MTPQAPPGIVFLDRDGVLNRPRILGVRHVRQLQLIPGAATAVARLTRAGFKIAVVTNKPGMALRLITPGRLGEIHDAVAAALKPEGGRIDAFYHCPHTRWAGCDCRKPRPGMLIRARDDLLPHPEAQWMVGDRCTDAEAGRAVGARTILVGAPDGAECRAADYFAPDLYAAADIILDEARHP